MDLKLRTYGLKLRTWGAGKLLVTIYEAVWQGKVERRISLDTAVDYAYWFGERSRDGDEAVQLNVCTQPVLLRDAVKWQAVRAGRVDQREKRRRENHRETHRKNLRESHREYRRWERHWEKLWHGKSGSERSASRWAQEIDRSIELVRIIKLIKMIRMIKRLMLLDETGQAVMEGCPGYR